MLTTIGVYLLRLIVGFAIAIVGVALTCDDGDKRNYVHHENYIVEYATYDTIPAPLWRIFVGIGMVLLGAVIAASW